MRETGEGSVQHKNDGITMIKGLCYFSSATVIIVVIEMMVGSRGVGRKRERGRKEDMYGGESHVFPIALFLGSFVTETQEWFLNTLLLCGVYLRSLGGWGGLPQRCTTGCHVTLTYYTDSFVC